MATLLFRCTVLLSALVPLAAGCAMSAGEGSSAAGSGSGTTSIEAENAVIAPERAQLGNVRGLLAEATVRADLGLENAACTPSSTASPRESGWRDMDFTGQEWAFGARYQHTAVWDGREMIVFGGAVGDAPEAAAYEPNRDEWSRVPASGLAQRVRHHAVWTGHSMIVWGGAINSLDGESTTYYDDGALYDPCTKAWRTIAKAPGVFHEGSTAVWSSTTRELVVLGGEGATANGWAYSPGTDSWRTLAASPIATTALHAVWTGDEMIAYDGATRATASYDPATDAWKMLPSAPTSAPTGEVALASGASLASATFLFGSTGKAFDPASSEGYFDMRGATWDTQARAWTTIPAPSKDVLAERTRAMTWWADGKLYVWGGHVVKDADPYVHTAQDGAVFDSTTGTWTHLPRAAVYAMREGASVVWTGREAIFTGGAASCTMCNPMPTGGEIFRP
jgi:N-acetylneuraminic acid mutarotase